MLLYIVPLPAVFSTANTAWPSYVAPRYSTSNATIYGTVAMAWKLWTWIYRTVAKTSVMHGWHWGQAPLTTVYQVWVYRPVAKTSAWMVLGACSTDCSTLGGGIQASG